MVGWDYQFLGNPVYSVENHAEQVNNAIAAKADIIVTELENAGMTPTFKQAISKGIVMVIIDQGVIKEADALGLGIIGEDPLVSGHHNGWQGASFAQKLTGKKEGTILFGNGNPGADLIDKRQQGSETAIQEYNKANGTNYSFVAFPDSSFDDESQSIQKYGAQIDDAGDKLVGVITGGNIVPGVKALQERGFKPGPSFRGLDGPATATAAADGPGLGAVGDGPAAIHDGPLFRGERLHGSRRLSLSHHPHRRGAAPQGRPRPHKKADGDLASQGQGLWRREVVRGKRERRARQTVLARTATGEWGT
jgi:ABC-type sugar transport system substrate-binding protein